MTSVYLFPGNAIQWRTLLTQYYAYPKVHNNTRLSLLTLTFRCGAKNLLLRNSLHCPQEAVERVHGLVMVNQNTFLFDFDVTLESP